MSAPAKHESLLDEILAANRAFLDGEPAPRPVSLGAGRLLVLTCLDSRLGPLLPRAFGVGPEELLFVRNAGNLASEDALRSVCAAVLVYGAKEVFVVGHSDCRMAKMTAMEVLGAMGRAGVPRDALGGVEPRAWFGAVGSVRQNALSAAKAVRACPVLPPATPVHALLVETETGAIEVIEQGYGRDAARATPPAGAPPRSPAATHPPPFRSEPAAPAPPPPSAEPRLEALRPSPPPPPPSPPPIPPPPPRKPATGLDRAADVLRKLRGRKP